MWDGLVGWVEFVIGFVLVMEFDDVVFVDVYVFDLWDGWFCVVFGVFVVRLSVVEEGDVVCVWDLGGGEIGVVLCLLVLCLLICWDCVDVVVCGDIVIIVVVCSLRYVIL